MPYRWEVVIVLGLLSVLAGCSPALDWREFEPVDSGLVVTFPCRPDRHARQVTVAGIATRMDMLVCTAADTTFALAFIDVADPARVTATLADLRAIAIRNLGSAVAPPGVAQIPGMTPHPLAARLALDGRQANGAALRQQAVFFVKGLRVYQASVIGAAPSGEAVDTFFVGLKLPS